MGNQGTQHPVDLVECTRSVNGLVVFCRMKGTADDLGRFTVGKNIKGSGVPLDPAEPDEISIHGAGADSSDRNAAGLQFFMQPAGKGADIGFCCTVDRHARIGHKGSNGRNMDDPAALWHIGQNFMGNGCQSADVQIQHPELLIQRTFIEVSQVSAAGTANEQGYFRLFFGQEFLQDEVTSESLFLKYDVFNAYDTLPYRTIDREGSENLQHIVDAIQQEELRNGLFAHHDYLAMLVRLFLITVQRYHRHDESHQALSITSPQHRHFVKFRQLLEQHYRQIHSVGQYAKMLGISSRTLTSCTLECSNQTPLQLINARLTLEAKRLLRFTHLSSKEVGYQLGFEDPSYFVKVFKQKTGQLPLEFRAT